MNQKLYQQMPIWQSVPVLPEISGCIGGRYRLAAHNNLAVLDWDGDFLKPFMDKSGKGGGYVGMGKTLEALARMAAYLRDKSLLKLRGHVLAALAGTQSADGYLGTYRPSARIKATWDVHELSYMVTALVTDWRLFGEARSLQIARRLGRYLMRRACPR